MPYISKDKRGKFSEALNIMPIIENPGELNYCITMLVKNYLQFHHNNYQIYNDCIGALEGAKLELYRRQIADYEDVKIAENGDLE